MPCPGINNPIPVQYPSELTDGTACCTSMTVGDTEAFLVRDGIRGSFDTIIGSDSPVEERGFVSVGHPVGTPEFVRAFCENRAAADKIRHKLDCLRVLDGHPQVQLSLLRLCVVPTCVSVARAVHCDAYAQSIGTADSLLHDAVASLADIPSWDGHAAVQRLSSSTASVIWPTTTSFAPLITHHLSFRGLMMCDVMTDRYPV